MSTQTQLIVNQSLSLSPEERAFVANALLQSLEDNPYTFETEWAKVAHQRSQEIKSGKVTPVSHKDFLSSIKLPNV
jgi:hypothetical protein